MPDPQPGGPGGAGGRKTLVRGADGSLYAVSKDGASKKLEPQQAQKLKQLIKEAEDALSAKVQAEVPVMGGGLNLCLPEIFP